LQALPKGGLPFKVSLPQSSTLQVGGKAHFALQDDVFGQVYTAPQFRIEEQKILARTVLFQS
jgi:hypothetical protein